LENGRRKVEASSVQRNVGSAKVYFIVRVGRSMPVASKSGARDEFICTRILEKTLSIDVSTRVSSD
jgi:hypothetical protein